MTTATCDDNAFINLLKEVASHPADMTKKYSVQLALRVQRDDGKRYDDAVIPLCTDGNYADLIASQKFCAIVVKMLNDVGAAKIKK